MSKFTLDILNVLALGFTILGVLKHNLILTKTIRLTPPILYGIGIGIWLIVIFSIFTS